MYMVWPMYLLHAIGIIIDRVCVDTVYVRGANLADLPPRHGMAWHPHDMHQQLAVSCA
jgi:hypothetical protein